MVQQWVVYSNRDLGVTLSHPNDWTVQPLGPDKFVVSAPAERDGYRPQLSYLHMVPDGVGEEWWAETIRYSEDQQRAAYPDYQLTRSEELTVAGARAFWRQCEWRYENTDTRSVNVQVMIWPGAESLFVLKAATLKTLADRDIHIFGRIILSTRLA